MTDIAQELRDATRKLPNGHAILGSGYVLAGFGITRDSDPLAESNYAVAMRQLCAVAGIDAMSVGFLGRPWFDDDPCDAPIAVAEFRHWACGWIHELFIRVDREDLVAKSVELVGRVADYPVLDDDDYAEREYAEQ
jgi:hypothetical protein